MFSVNAPSIFLASPLEQFEVYTIAAGISNAHLFWVLALAILIGWFQNYRQNNLWIPTATQRWSHIVEILQEQLTILTVRNVGRSVGQRYYPWLLFTFLIVTTTNLVGMIPYSFTVTSHIVVTFSLAFILFIGINIEAVLSKQSNFFGLFLPSTAPTAISFFLVIIELISYVARVFSLAIRLFANMMAGHTLLKILIGFSFLIIFQLPTTIWPIWFLGLIPFLLVYIITFLEVAIAILQGYVFTVLFGLYIKDLHVAH